MGSNDRITDLPRRISNKIMPVEDGCWLWTGAAAIQGYGSVSWRDNDQQPWRRVGAHRLIYQLLRGPIPDGLECDHLCRVPACVNPSHIDIVTRRENQRRGNGPCGINSRKTHCPAGHPYEPENIYWVNRKGRHPSRICKTCAKARTNERHRRLKREREAEK